MFDFAFGFNQVVSIINIILVVTYGVNTYPLIIEDGMVNFNSVTHYGIFNCSAIKNSYARSWFYPDTPLRIIIT